MFSYAADYPNRRFFSTQYELQTLELSLCSANCFVVLPFPSMSSFWRCSVKLTLKCSYLRGKIFLKKVTVPIPSRLQEQDPQELILKTRICNPKRLLCI